MPLESRDASNNGPAKPLEENFAHTEAAIDRTSEAEGDSVDRGATNDNNDGTAEQGEFERLVAEAAAQLPKPAQLASVPSFATVGDGIWPPHS